MGRAGGRVKAQEVPRGFNGRNICVSRSSSLLLTQDGSVKINGSRLLNLNKKTLRHVTLNLSFDLTERLFS